MCLVLLQCHHNTYTHMHTCAQGRESTDHPLTGCALPAAATILPCFSATRCIAAARSIAARRSSARNTSSPSLCRWWRRRSRSALSPSDVDGLWLDQGGLLISKACGGLARLCTLLYPPVTAADHTDHTTHAQRTGYSGRPLRNTFSARCVIYWEVSDNVFQKF